MKSIQWKIMSLVALIIISILSVNLILINLTLDKTSNYTNDLLKGQLTEKVALIERGVNAQVSNITQQSILVAEQIASNPQVIQALKSKDKDALHKLLDGNAETFKQQLGIDLIWLTSLEDRTSDGKTPILACPSNPAFDGFDQLNYSSTNKALDTGTTVSSWEVNEEDGKLQITAPIEENGKVIGAVVVGKQTYKSMLKVISDSTDTANSLFLINNNDYYVMTDVEKDDLGTLVYGDSHEKLKAEAKSFSDLIKQKPVYSELKLLLDEVKTTAKPLTKIVELNKKPYAAYLIPLFSDTGEVNGVLFNRIPGFVASQQEIKEKTSSLQQTGFVILFILFIAGLFFSYLLSKNISNPIKKIASLLHDIANGDLTKPIKHQSKDEIGLLFQSATLMVNSLKSIIQDVDYASSQVAASSEELTAGASESSKASEVIALSASEVAAGAENQFTSVKKSKEAVGDIAEHVEIITNHIESAASLAQSTSASAESGNVLASETMNQMLFIQEKSNLTQEVVVQLNYKTKEISKILVTMSDIATQTNLLSLNASIEAARAGEAGRGFAVVAGEIRKLADQSANFAKQIEFIIDEIQQESHRSISSIHDAKSAVEDGVSLVSKSGEVFNDVFSSIENIAAEMQEVSGAITLIAQGTANLVSSIASIEQISQDSVYHTQNVAASAEEQTASMGEISSAAGELAKMAEELQSVVGKFKI
ncbi:methyl-accepting chemotaxis protein [Cohnella sp.]|uniref:methyl-accepting chemotaxis protein n=1 Tax=Cohnella sp. TaxID=1883426 RepID=UPI003567A96E